MPIFYLGWKEIQKRAENWAWPIQERKIVDATHILSSMARREYAGLPIRERLDHANGRSFEVYDLTSCERITGTPLLEIVRTLEQTRVRALATA